MFDGHGTEGPPSTCSRLPQGAQMTTLTIGTDVHLGKCRLKPNRLAKSRSGRYLFRRDAELWQSNRRPSFDPKSFLAKIGEGRSIGNYRKDQIVFSQGDPAIRSSSSRRARSRSRLYRSKARKQSSQFSEQTISSEMHVWPDRRGASRRSRQWGTSSSCGWRKRRLFG